jgi:hypothetical protein
MRAVTALLTLLLAACSKVVVVVNGKHEDKVLDVKIEKEDKLKEREKE